MIMEYTLHQLRILVKVAEHKSITKAAEVLHLTQPGVSIQLKKLQDQLEVPLVEIIGRKLYVTDFGQEIVEASKTILHEVNSIKNRTLAYKGFLVGQLKISVVSTAKYLMPYFLSDFIGDNAGVELKMDVTNKSDVLNSFINNEPDFALVSVVPENINVNRIELTSNKLYFCGPKSDLNQKELKAKEISKLPLIFREQGSATRLAMEKFFVQNKVSVRKTMELTSNEAVKQAVIAGLGYSLMPIIGLKNSLVLEDIKIIPVQGLPISSTWNLIWLKDKKLSPIAQAYLNYVQENKDAIIKNKFSWYEQY